MARLASKTQLEFALALTFIFLKSHVWAEKLRPNVLFLAVDDMRDWIGCLKGYSGEMHTPNIDALANGGMLFTNAHCPSPKCGPSRAAILTGLRSSTTGLYDNNQWLRPNLPKVVTLPEHFKANGYEVVGSGKIHHHTAGNNPPDQWNDFNRLTFRNDPWFRGHKLNYPWSRHADYPKGFPFSRVKGLGHENDWGILPIAEVDHDDAKSADYAVSFLKKKGVAEKNPFFLACGLFRPHLPWYAPKKYFELYHLDKIILPETPAKDLSDVPPLGRKLAAARKSDLITIRNAGRQKEAVRAYLASISFADAQLGRILRALSDSPHASSTIVVLWSDHGWHLGEKSHWHKSTLWEVATRVPLVIRAPGHRSGLCSRPVSLIDLFPTLLELCNLPLPGPLDGLSLVPQLRDPGAARARPALIEYQKGNAAIRSERWRYIRYKDGSEELYDHQKDPSEWNNLAKDSESEEVKRQLAKYLPAKWAKPLPSKASFLFDPESFSWTDKKTGKVISGNRSR